MVTMLNLKKISRQQVITLVVLSSCGILGAGLGWISMSFSNNTLQRANTQNVSEQAPPFLLPAAPIERMETDNSASVVDPAELQIWELAARQALPPRKEPLTPPRWRIVGVTVVGNEKNVLLLFANQTATETRKVGDKLPGGAKILQISQDHLQIALNGQPMKLNLRKQ